MDRVSTTDVALTDAIKQGIPRAVAPERAVGVPEESRIVTASNAQIGLGTVGAAGAVISQIAPAITEAEGARDLAERFAVLVGLGDALSIVLPWLATAVFLGVIVYAVKARAARIEDHRTGRTP